ncbi:hypothetical protein PENTCL1PPCAC_3382, partial [Pristionchus entomophagus]
RFVVGDVVLSISKVSQQGKVFSGSEGRRMRPDCHLAALSDDYLVHIIRIANQNSQSRGCRYPTKC